MSGRALNFNVDGKTYYYAVSKPFAIPTKSCLTPEEAEAAVAAIESALVTKPGAYEELPYAWLQPLPTARLSTEFEGLPPGVFVWEIRVGPKLIGYRITRSDGRVHPRILTKAQVVAAVLAIKQKAVVRTATPKPEPTKAPFEP